MHSLEISNFLVYGCLPNLGFSHAGHYFLLALHWYHKLMHNLGLTKIYCCVNKFELQISSISGTLVAFISALQLTIVMSW